MSVPVVVIITHEQPLNMDYECSLSISLFVSSESLNPANTTGQNAINMITQNANKYILGVQNVQIK